MYPITSNKKVKVSAIFISYKNGQGEVVFW